MQSRVKEFFNKLEAEKIYKETIREKALARYYSRNKWRKDYGVNIEFHLPKVKKDTTQYHFMEDENNSNIALIVWEHLEIDFSNIERRYCEKCNDYVYRASNITILKKLHSEEKKVAISANLFELTREEMSDKEYQLFQNKMKITLFLMIYFKYKSTQSFNRTNLNRYIDTKTLKEILESIIQHRYAFEWLKFFSQHGIDMEFIIIKILEYINEDTLSKDTGG